MSVTLTDDQRATLTVLTAKMTALGLSVKPVNEVTEGPVVSIYKFLPVGSTKISNIEGLSQDFALILGVYDVVVKRVPGDVAVSIFVPNRERKLVYWRDICQVPTNGERPKIPLLMGVDHLGRKILEDLTTFPHLLVAGATGGGKSTWLNSNLATIIFNYSTNEIRLALVDTKKVEFNHFFGTPHLWSKPALSVDTSIELFNDLISEMEARLSEFSKRQAKNIIEYNQIVPYAPKPYICLCIDEVADILSDKRRPEEGRGPSAGQLAQGKLSQLASKARASGIHIIAATQRPSVRIIEGDIKANFLGRLAFRLPSEADSRTVLNASGADHLLARGDMLFINPNKAGIHRIHAPIASNADIAACIEYASRREK